MHRNIDEEVRELRVPGPYPKLPNLAGAGGEGGGFDGLKSKI